MSSLMYWHCSNWNSMENTDFKSNRPVFWRMSDEVVTLHPCAESSLSDIISTIELDFDFKPGLKFLKTSRKSLKNLIQTSLKLKCTSINSFVPLLNSPSDPLNYMVKLGVEWKMSKEEFCLFTYPFTLISNHITALTFSILEGLKEEPC